MYISGPLEHRAVKKSACLSKYIYIHIYVDDTLIALDQRPMEKKIGPGGA